MKKFMALFLIAAIMAGFMSAVTMADTSYRILYLNSFDSASDDIVYSYISPEYITSSEDPVTKGELLRLNSTDEGEYKKSSTMKINPATCNVDKPDMYGVLQFDVSMTSMLADSKNVYIYFDNAKNSDGTRSTNRIIISPRGTIDLGGSSVLTDKYDTRALKLWDQNSFNRVRFIYRFSDGDGNKSDVSICGLYVNETKIDLNREVVVSSGVESIGNVIIFLSQRKTEATNPFYADFGNMFFAVTYSYPVFSDNSTLKNTILNYYNYISNIEGENEEDISTFVSNIKGNPSSAVNNPLLAQSDVDRETENVRSIYYETFCGENYSNFKDELNKACQKAKRTLD